MSIPRHFAALLVVAALALPAAAAGQTLAQTRAQSQPSPTQEPGTSRPPVDLGGSNGERSSKRSGSSRAAAKGTLPDTGTDPRLLFLTGLALTLLGVGLRLRTADADAY